jgi:glycosyltransferase involved in cell wall biosynthesis
MILLYITYDGLLDPLGASQILPYIKIIAQSHGRVIVLSFEKNDRISMYSEQKYTEIKDFDIEWKPLRFTRGFGFFGKLWDLVKMYFWAWWLSMRYKVYAVHARGHPAAQVGLFVKKILGTKLIFDFRGLWVDERVDKGGWDVSRFWHRKQYQYFKKVERILLRRADQIVVLTNAVLGEMNKLGGAIESKITVIPCCADFDHFFLASEISKVCVRHDAQIPDDAFVIGYLGSVGPMYMLNCYFRFIELAFAHDKSVHSLIITPDIELLKKLINEYLPVELHNRVHFRSATRNEVPAVLSAMDVMVSFITPSYARMAASPTKLAECFASGIPVICNDGVGDVSEQVAQLGAGIIVDPASDIDLLRAVDCLDEIYKMGGQRLREKSRPLLGLERAESLYKSVYCKIVSNS